MAAAKPVMVQAGDREVRVSSPDRVIYEATDVDRRGHQADGGGVLRRGRGRPDAGAARPADGPRALDHRRARGHEAGHRSQRPQTPTRSTRSACPRALPTTSRRVEITFPSRPHRRGDLPDRDRGAGVVRPHGHADLPPLAGARAATSTIPTSCGSTSTRSRARRSPTPCGSPGSPASCSTSSA